MKDRTNGKSIVDSIFTLGLLSFILYAVTKKYLWEIPDVVSVLWLLLSTVLVIVGTFKEYKRLVEILNK